MACASDCPVCGNISSVKYASSATEKPRPFCGACHRRLPVLEVYLPPQPMRATLAERVQAHRAA